MFGCSAEQAIGESLDRFIPERFRATHHQHIERFGKTRVTKRSMGSLGPIHGVRSNGEEFPIEASISQMESDGHHFFTVILRDITERKKLEAQFLRAQRLESIGTLASGIAHDMNNILSPSQNHRQQRPHRRRKDDGSRRPGRRDSLVQALYGRELARHTQQPGA